MEKRHINNLVIISHVVHYKWDNFLYAYGPYAREIEIWADLFPQVVIAAPLRNEKPPLDCLAFSRKNIHISPQLELGGNTWRKKFIQIISLPVVLFGLSLTMWKANAIHVRCPGNLGLLGVILAPLFSHYRIAKYAGQWNGYEGEAWSYRLQRSILGSWWWKAPVTVYGKWDNQPGHVIPFFTSILESTHLENAKRSAYDKGLHQPLRVLFVGRLTREKNIHALLNGLRLLQEKTLQFECRIIGEGPMREELAQQVPSMGLNVNKILIGALPFEKVLESYEWADVLVLASETEGWPKAITEGMAFGLVCIGSNRGLVPQILADGRGLIVEPGDSTVLASVLEDIINQRVDFMSTSRRAAEWGQNYSLEGLKEALRKLLTQEWHLDEHELG